MYFLYVWNISLILKSTAQNIVTTAAAINPVNNLHETLFKPFLVGPGFTEYYYF